VLPGLTVWTQQRQAGPSRGVCPGQEPYEHGAGLGLPEGEPRQYAGIERAEVTPSLFAGIQEVREVCLAHHATAVGTIALGVDTGHVGTCLPRTPRIGKASP
jgi:hypothetical protein